VSFQLAQFNVALPLEPLGTPLLADFVAALDSVNAAAEASPGFVWRLAGEDGNATSLRSAGDARLILNMSVWESLDALRAFVYAQRAHRDVMRRRREWFEHLGETHMALWWVAAGHRPTLAEADQRLAIVRRDGPTADAFTFRVSFAPPDGGAAGANLDARELCPSP
jgi:heme-degrading monooxygenase HmoA